MSMKRALDILGFGPCHHMEEVLKDQSQVAAWLAAAKGEEHNWDEMFKGYTSCVDWPSAAYWRELANYYPDAKIILTNRTAESWYASISKTIFATIGEKTEENAEHYTDFFEMVWRMVGLNTFDGDITNKDHVIEVFNANVKAAQDAFPSDRLLTYTIGDGWQPLCDWLGVAVPDIPFPRTNNKEEFFEHFDKD
jgi:hypothetical protein